MHGLLASRISIVRVRVMELADTVNVYQPRVVQATTYDNAQHPGCECGYSDSNT